jgi:shikimate dehydrogenase
MLRAASPGTEVVVGPPVVDGMDLLLNATPVGMLDDARLPFDESRLPASLVRFDAIVMPERTPLLAHAEACGCRTVRGREMMRGQIRGDRLQGRVARLPAAEHPGRADRGLMPHRT